MSVLWRFLVLYSTMYAAFGVSSPFLPAFFQSRGLSPEQLGIVVGAGTAIRLVSGPLCGRLADLTRARRVVLAACSVIAALVTLSLLRAAGFPMVLVIGLVQAAALAPITTLADALAVSAAAGRDAADGFEYGWVRGTGSALFIAGTLVSGQVVGAWGLASIVGMQAALLGAAACAALPVPEPAGGVGCGREGPTPPAASRRDPRSAGELLRIAPFRRLVLVSALVLGSHAMHDAFAVIRWSAAGVTSGEASILWSEAVAAEVVVFFLVGPALLKRLAPASVLVLAAAAGIIRWGVMASTSELPALALVQPLHGITFAALHLACMRLIVAIVPPRLAATAQAMYALGAVATTALLTVVSGQIYARVGATGFLAMALLCAAAVPIALRLRGAQYSL